ncbi:MAG: hydrogenase maturation protease [Candidatus Limnocylindrales bacterium]
MADPRPSEIPGEPAPPTQIVRGRAIVIGLGNPLLGDDGVGWRVADEVEGLLAAARRAGRPIAEVDIERLGVGGLRLMECLTGYEAAVLVDAAEFPDRPIGEVRACCFDDLEDYAAGHLDSAHDASLRTALDLGRRLGAALPESIHAVTIQAHRTDEFSEELTPEVAAAIPTAAAAVVELLAPAPDQRPTAEKRAIG